MTGRFQYKARSAEQWEKQAQGNNFASPFLDQYEVFSAKEDNWIRILPPTFDGAEHFGMIIYVHFGVGPDNVTLLCERRSGDGRCPICDDQTKAETQGKDELAKELKPTKRVLIWLIDRKDDKVTVPKLWAMPQSVNEEICALCKDPRSGAIIMIDNPDIGYDNMFKVTGKRPNIKYIAHMIDRTSTQVEESYLEYITQHPLDKVINHRSYEQVKSIHEGKKAPVAAATEVAERPAEPEVEVVRRQVAPEPVVERRAVSTTTREERPPIVIPCEKTKPVKVAGKWLACGFSTGHEGDCDYVLEVNGPAPAPTATGNGAVEAKTGQDVQPAPAQSTSARLRSHFQTGGGLK